MDGIEATAAIRELEQGKSRRLPVIAMTAHAMKGDRSRFLESGMDAYIAKPVQARELFTVIEQTVPQPEEAPQESPPQPAPLEIIDWKRGLAAADGDSALLHDLLRIFANEAPATLDKLRSAVETNDAPAIERAAHTLKGAVSNFGVEAAVQAALKLEIMGRQRNLEHAGEAFRAVEQEIRRVLAAIETLETGVPG
jgi:CheY-like chemotaxis protein